MKKPLELVNEFKNRLATRQLAGRDYAILAGSGLLGAHGLSLLNGNEKPPELVSPQTIGAYGNPATANGGNVAVVYNQETGSAMPVNVPALSEEDLGNQTRYISRKIATDLATLRTLEGMQQQLLGASGNVA